MSAIFSMKIEITMPKLAGNSISASTRTAPPPSQTIPSLIHFHSKWAKERSAHHARAAMPIWSSRLTSSDHQMMPRSFGSPSWRTASSKARIIAAPSLRADDPCRSKVADPLGREALLAQDLVGVLAALGGGSLDAFLGAREARRGGGLREARDIDIGAACLGVRMLRGFLHGEHGGEADVGALHDGAPFIARLGAEDVLHPALELRPGLAVHLRRQALALEAGLLEQQGVELRLDRAHRDELAVLCLVGAVEVRAAVQHVGLAFLFVPQAGARHAIDAAQQQRRAVDHRRVDHLALARALRLEKTAHHAEGQKHAAAAEVTDQVQRRCRLVLDADGVQRAGEGDVVDVVAGRLGERSLLAPAR